MIALVARVLLAAVFASAAAAKLTGGRARTEATLKAFGVGSGVGRLIARCLPVAEFALAATLLVTPAASVAAWAALALLIAFSLAIAAAIRSGQRVSCSCFGGLSERAVGMRTLARNVLFAALALAVLIDPTHPRHGTITTAAGALVAVSAAALAVRRSGPRAAGDGSPAPDFTIADTDGNEVGLAELLAPRLPVLLVFSNPECPACRRLVPSVAAWQRERADELTVAVIASGDHRDVQHDRDANGLGLVLRQRDRAVSRAYGIVGTPTGVLVDVDGTIGAVALGQPEIERLVDAHDAGRTPSVLERGLTRRRTLKFAGLTMLAGSAASWLSTRAPLAADRVCDQAGLNRCTAQAATRSRVGVMLCRFQPLSSRAPCRRAAQAQHAVLLQQCEQAHCTCPASTSACTAGTTTICCSADEQCQASGRTPQCGPNNQPPTPPGPCPQDPVTADSLTAARAALAAGANDVALSPAGCLRYARTLSGSTITAETITGAGTLISQFNYDPSGSATGQQDFDADGFFEWRGTVTIGTNPQKTVEIDEYSPTTRQLMRRRRRMLNGSTVHVIEERDEGSGQELYAEYDVPTGQDLDRIPRAPSRPIAHAAAGGGGPMIDSSCSSITSDLNAAWAGCLATGPGCLHKNGLTSVETEMSKLTSGSVSIFCDSSASFIAHFDSWYDHPLTSGSTITVNPTKFTAQSANDQAGGICHELMHGTSLGEHDPDLIGSVGLRIDETDRVTACTQLCFGASAFTTQCHCATCLGSTVCDKHCAGLKTCDCELPAKCLCPTRSKWYRKLSDCRADCPSGLACFGFSSCASHDVCCTP